jgi:hypothetical protein
MAHELLRLFDVGVRRRKRRLKYAQRLASKLESILVPPKCGVRDSEIVHCVA